LDGFLGKLFHQIEHLPSKHKALSLNASTTKKEKEKRGEEKGRGGEEKGRGGEGREREGRRGKKKRKRLISSVSQ
jgi:hypothetical protein